ncbi:hypothetical protein Bca4012_068324 [Brassica carinata]
MLERGTRSSPRWTNRSLTEGRPARFNLLGLNLTPCSDSGGEKGRCMHDSAPVRLNYAHGCGMEIQTR